MSPFQGAFVKATEVLLLFPFHHALHKSQANCKKKLEISNFYKGLHFQIIQSPLNRMVDIYLYETYGPSIQSSLLSSCFKLSTYPLHTAEVCYQLKNKLPTSIIHCYKGIAPYSIINMSSYYVWFNSLQWYNRNIPKIENEHLHNGIVGFLSGLTVDVLMHPLKTIKTNLQNDTFKFQDLKRLQYFSRGLGIKVIISAFQTAYFNVFCPIP